MTVTVSAAVASSIGRLTVMTCPTSSCRFSRVTALNPASSALSRYTPTRPVIRYTPRASVTAMNVFPVASSTAVTVTPGRTAPVDR